MSHFLSQSLPCLLNRIRIQASPYLFEEPLFHPNLLVHPFLTTDAEILSQPLALPGNKRFVANLLLLLLKSSFQPKRHLRLWKSFGESVAAANGESNRIGSVLGEKVSFNSLLSRPKTFSFAWMTILTLFSSSSPSNPTSFQFHGQTKVRGMVITFSYIRQMYVTSLLSFLSEYGSLHCKIISFHCHYALSKANYDGIWLTQAMLFVLLETFWRFYFLFLDKFQTRSQIMPNLPHLSAHSQLNSFQEEEIIWYKKWDKVTRLNPRNGKHMTPNKLGVLILPVLPVPLPSGRRSGHNLEEITF